MSPLKEFISAVRPLVPSAVKSLILDWNGDYRRSVFLAGVGRSGTTWVSSILNYDNHYRDIFEPFHSHFVRPARHFVYSLYIRPENSDFRYLRPASRILRGRIRNWWRDQANRRRFVGERLIKEIRANLWLKWLKVHFPELPIILLLRHPCAVAASQAVLEWPTRLPRFLVQRELMQDYLEPFRDAMLAARTPFERRIFVWCIQHFVPLSQFLPGELHLAFFENFVYNPEEEIDRLFRFLGRPYDGRVFQVLSKLSRTASTRKDDVRGSTRPWELWRHSTDRSSILKAIEILHLFGLQSIYGEELLPNMAAAHQALSGFRKTSA